MRNIPLALFAVTMLMAACDNDTTGTSAVPSSPAQAETPKKERATEIYSAVVRRLVTEDHTLGSGASPFEHVYIVNGPIMNAGKPLGDHFGPASKPFPSSVVDGMKQELRDLPKVRFVIDANDLRRGREGVGGVKNEGVIISLGPIQYRDGKVHVSNGLWCGGLCGQWLTYVLRKDQGEWKITGTTGPVAIS